MRVLILGAEGMIGRAIYGVLESSTGWDVFGTSRRAPDLSMSNWVSGVNAYEIETLNASINTIKPNVVINCIGLTKHRDEGNQPISAITVNALFPHLLAGLCDKHNTRLIHISTDCVFSGRKGCYTELDTPDASDVYGRSKILGELNYPHTITLRTSTIGHGQ
jgi:dTDP-4-dehydrorhamnose reductase